jgi:hypothetical protein
MKDIASVEYPSFKENIALGASLYELYRKDDAGELICSSASEESLVRFRFLCDFFRH